MPGRQSKLSEVFKKTTASPTDSKKKDIADPFELNTDQATLDAFLSLPGLPVAQYKLRISDACKAALKELEADALKNESKIFAYVQGSVDWLRARVGCATASNSAAMVGHNKYSSPIKHGLDINHPVPMSYFGKEACAYGVENEPRAREQHCVWLQSLVNIAFRTKKKDGTRKYWRQDADGAWCLLFRKRLLKFKLDDKGQPKIPLVVLVESGSLLLQSAPWKRCSLDALVLIDGVVVGFAEYKCPVSKCYLNIPVYYYDQTQTACYIANAKYGGSCDWIDFLVWTPWGFLVDTLILDRSYYETWYLPRELRYFFTIHLPEYVKWLEIHKTEAQVEEDEWASACDQVLASMATKTCTDSCADMPPLEPDL